MVVLSGKRTLSAIEGYGLLIAGAVLSSRRYTENVS